MGNATAKHAQKYKCQKNVRGHTDLNHGPIGLQPIALPLSYIPKTKDWGVKHSTTRGR